MSEGYSFTKKVLFNKDDLTLIPQRVIDGIRTSPVAVYEIFMMIYSTASIWDDIVGILESYFDDTDYINHFGEDNFHELILELQDLFLDFTNKCGRSLLHIRDYPLGYGVWDVECFETSPYDVLFVISYDLIEENEDLRCVETTDEIEKRKKANSLYSKSRSVNGCGSFRQNNFLGAI